MVGRRRFLRTGAGAVAGAAAGCGGRKSRWRALTENEARTLAAICDQIVPPDTAPGAGQAGVAVYIDRQLARRFREHLPTYREGLKLVEKWAGGDFAALPGGRQLEILEQLEAEKHPFFALAVTHTLQGYYGDPRHGGNRDYASWRMLGVAPAPVRGRDPYRL